MSLRCIGCKTHQRNLNKACVWEVVSMKSNNALQNLSLCPKTMVSGRPSFASSMGIKYCAFLWKSTMKHMEKSLGSWRNPFTWPHCLMYHYKYAAKPYSRKCTHKTFHIWSKKCHTKQESWLCITTSGS